MFARNFNFIQDFNDEEEDTLSFSDLPLNNNSSLDNHWDDDFSRELDQTQDFFEFFSEEFSSSFSSSTHLTDNIIFCGKLIPSKESNEVSSKNLVPDREINLYPCNSRKKSQSFDVSSRTNSFKKPQQHERYYKNCKSFPPDHHKYGFSKKRSICYLFGRFPTAEMELTDIKKRQRKKLPTAKLFPSDEKSEIVENRRKKKVKNLWSLLKLFACRTHHARPEEYAR